MVAPNIVTTRSIVAKTETVNLTTTPAVVLQNSANSNQLYKISVLFAANVTDENAAITVILTKTDESGTIAKKIAHEIPIPANATLTLLDRNVPIYLEERMTLIIYADIDLAIDIVCAYEEIGEKAALTISSSNSSLSNDSVSSSSLSSSSLSSSSLSSSSLSSASVSSSSLSSSSASPAQEYACVTPKTETFACVEPLPGTYLCVEPLPGTYLCVEPISQSSSSSSAENCADIPDRFSGGTPSLFGALTGFGATEPVIFEKTEDGGWIADYVVTNQATEYCAQDCQIEISISLLCEDNKLNVGARVGGVDCEIIFDDEVGNNITTDENGNTLLPGFLFVTDTIDHIDINCADDEPIAPQCLCPTTQPCAPPPVVGPPWPPGPVDDLAIKLEVDAGNNNILIPPPAPQGAPQPLRLGLVDCPGCGDVLVTAELITGSAETETAYNNIVELSCDAGPVTRIGQGRYKASICPAEVGELQITFTATWKNLTKSETITVNVEYCPSPSDTSSEPSDSAECGYIECGGTQSYADCYLIDDGLTYELDCARCECVPVPGPSDTSTESTASENSAAAGQCDYPCEMMWSYGNWIPTGMYGPGCDGFTCVCPEPDRPGNYENELVFMTCQPNPLP